MKTLRAGGLSDRLGSARKIMVMVVVMMDMLFAHRSCRFGLGSMNWTRLRLHFSAAESAKAIGDGIHAAALGAGTLVNFRGAACRNNFGALFKRSVTRKGLNRLQGGSDRFIARLWPAEVVIHFAEEVLSRRIRL